MKGWIIKVGMLSLLLMLCFSLSAIGDEGVSFFLAASKQKLIAGEAVEIEVFVREAPLVYGAEVVLSFDPEKLEVLDSDNKVKGTQLEPGDFLDPEKSFFIENKASNKKGTMSYMMTLLNPAPAVKGEGLLFRTKLLAKKSGEAKLFFTEGKLGTAEGKTIKAGINNSEITLTIEEKTIGKDSKGEDKDSGVSPFSLRFFMILFGILAVIWIFKERKK